MGSSGPSVEGRLLGGRYRLVTRIATGGMGEVWAARDTVLHRQVAVKVLKDELVDHRDFLERFRAEARHTASLAHPGIATVFDYGEDTIGEDTTSEGSPGPSAGPGRCTAYLVMELVPGEPLSDVLRRDGTLPVDTALSLLAQSADALQAAHDMGVVHRDVKPGNLLIVDGTTVKVTDFGIARAANSVPLTEVGQVIGTAQYMSPEQAVGGEATPASDVYALALIGYEMLAGHRPFTADSPAAVAMAQVHQPVPPLADSIPVGVRDAIEGALAKDPLQRPPDARAFADELRRLRVACAAQRLAMPPPAALRDDALPPPAQVVETSIMNHPTSAATALLPAGGLSVASPSIVIAGQPTRGHGTDVNRRARIAVVVGVGVVVALLVWMATQRQTLNTASAATTTTVGGPSPSPSASASALATQTSGVTVTAAAFVGQPAADIVSLLTDAGLVITQVPTDIAGTAAGIIVGVSPEGVLARGSALVIDVSTGNAPNGGKGKGHKGGG